MMWCSKAALVLVAASIESCRASLAPFYTYEPRTKVTDHAAIDLDQREIETELGKATEVGFQNALGVYKDGAHSKSVAFLTLDSPLTVDLVAGSDVTGTAVNGEETSGTLMEAAETGENVIKVQYATSEVLESHVNCQVGSSVTPLVDGCFASSGTVTVGSAGELPYTYTVESDNRNSRSIAGFTEDAQSKMWACANCPYVDYAKFYDYYGRYDYADKWITAAFEAGSTDLSNGGANFADVDIVGRAEAVKKGSAYMAIWMYVIREMEDALDDCSKDCGIDECNDDSVHAWDEAVAFYHGSLSPGYLLFTLANKRCANFATCGDDADETTGDANVNVEIFDLFNDGREMLLKGQCEDARPVKERIVEYMTVPLIQGTLRYAYIIGGGSDDSDKSNAEGATFAAAVLPMVNSCSPSDAAIIYDNMGMNAGTPNFQAVKTAFENNYGCLGISCKDVGGIVNSDGEYEDGAEPCGGITRSGAFSLSMTLGLVGGILSATLLALW